MNMNAQQQFGAAVAPVRDLRYNDSRTTGIAAI